MNGTTSSHRNVWYLPVPGESRNWLPPTEVQQSTNATIRAALAARTGRHHLRVVRAEDVAVPHVE
jgi:hypothetical protein